MTSLKREAPVRPIEERAEALRSAIVGAVQTPVQDRDEAFRRSWAVSNMIHASDAISILNYVAMFGSIGYETHNDNHDHFILFTDGVPRHGRLATISIIRPNSEDYETEKPETHDHPDDTVEYVILVDGTLDNFTEGNPRTRLTRLYPSKTSGKHTVINGDRIGQTSAWYLCLRYKIEPNEPQE